MVFFFFTAINCSEIFGIMMYNLGLQGDTFDTQMLQEMENSSFLLPLLKVAQVLEN